jgi:hypothetical protein
MPIFARRRLQSMLDALGPLLSQAKAKDLLARLEHKNAKDALAAEVELGLLWSIKQVAHLEVDPKLEGSSSRPDAFSNDLFGQTPAIIEITALSDDTFSGQEQMDRAANIICQFANRVRKGAGEHLYFQFLEENRHQKGFRRRIRRITPQFKLTPDFQSILRHWLDAPDWPNPEAIRMADAEIDVVIQWRKHVHPLGRTFTSMPAVADHAEDNPVFRALRRKERQISGAPSGVLKCIFLGDAGCSMLRELKPLGPHDVSGDHVIKYFLSRSSIDIVCVFSPYRGLPQLFGGGHRSPEWKVSVYFRTTRTSADTELLHKMVGVIPRPRLEGYQARAWHQQGMFDPQGKGIYLGCEMTSKGGVASIKISSRMVLELLAGRITQDQFQHFAFGDHPNLFDSELKHGLTLQEARLEKAGLDHDDDYLVFDLEPDWSAKKLANPKLK